jgi:branched-chain amino acid transport system permease protein
LTASTLRASLGPEGLREWLRPDVLVRRLPVVLGLAAIVFALLWVLVLAEPFPESGDTSWRTTNSGSAIDDWRSFYATFLDAITQAGWLFIVASGFSLIFGLMRVVNMAHGAFYLLGGYIAYEIQQAMTGTAILQGGLGGAVNTWEWIVPALVAAACIGVVGLIVQQSLLRWNQGQDLRQALITIAVSVIVADQIIAHFPRTGLFQQGGGNQVDMYWPGWTSRFVDIGINYSVARLFMLGIGVAVGVGLFLWLYRTKIGMVIRAGVDDRQMTAALGVNIMLVFAIAFFVGSALAGFGSAVGASQGGHGQPQDVNWLLNSLVVVIVGGMGSLLGAAAGSLLYALVLNFSAAYLPSPSPNCCTQYSIVLTFALIAVVLAFRPQGLFGRAG